MSNETHQKKLAPRTQLFVKDEAAYLLGSLLLQLLLGMAFGHAYDIRIAMATGHLVATGQNPYIPQDLTTVFHHPAFQGMTSVGYPPPWPMLLGLIYNASYALVPNLLFYNLAIKLPIIAANFGLAYLVRQIVREHHPDPNVSRKAWIFLLFNPFLLYFTTAWGQLDSMVALLTLLALVTLNRQKEVQSAILLALALALKPISIPILVVAIFYLWGKPWLRLARFLATLAISGFMFCIAPFILLGWDPSPIVVGWNAQFTVSGGMSVMTYYELLKNTTLLPGSWWLLGLAWIPAVLLGSLWLKPGISSFTVLLKHSLGLTLIFFLFRTWLSEPNLSLILPMVLILVSLGELPRFIFGVTWILPLVFTFFNTSTPQLLFPILPQQMERLLEWMDIYRSPRLMMRMILVIPWQVVGWSMVVNFLRRRRGRMYEN